VASARFKVALAAGAVVGVAAIVSFGPVVRYEAARVAERYGATLEIDEVRPSWRGVELHGIDVSVPELPSTQVHFDAIEVSLGLGGTKVALRGGNVSAIGPRDTVIQEAERWRERHLASRSPRSSREEPHSRTEAEFVGLRVSWQDRKDAPTEAVRASDVSFARQDGKVGISAEEATITVGPASVTAAGGHLTLVKHQDGGYRVAALSARALDAALTLPAPLEEAKPPSDAGQAAGASTNPPARDHEAQEPSGATGARDKILKGAHAIDAVLEQGATVQLDSLHAKIQRGRDSLNLGPGSLLVHRAEGQMLVELKPGAHAEQSEQALTFRLLLPLQDPRGEIVADVKGGPIWLSTLGIRDGDLGLFDVAKTSLVTRSHLVLSPDGRRLRVDGDGRLHHLSLRSDALSDEPVAGLELAFRLRGDVMLDGSAINVEEGEVDLGAIRLLGHGKYERHAEGRRVRAEFELPLTACQAMLDSAPRGLVPRLTGMRMAGSFAIKGSARFDTAHLDRDYHFAWDTSNTCRVTEAPPEIDIVRRRKPFRRTVLGPTGERVEIESGPGTAGWVPFSAISRFMEAAVMTTEDGGFRRHGGFDSEAIRNSIRENLRKGRFVRGASTISMQVAKNLYLDREKNLSRKLQEAVLTSYLEQELTKEQILELYFNVIEFGPMIYGIGPAARHYFNTSASELSLGQAFYIASILPNPKQQHFAMGGAVSERWTNYLRKMMQLANRRKWVTDEELEEGLRETIVRGQPAPERAARDPNASTTTLPATEGQANDVDPPEGADWLGP
jgi:hypothetical protein